MQDAAPASVLDMRGVAKRFGGVEALRGVDFSARSGEVHALLGENGAGKSTLMNILSGVFAPDRGEIRLDGAPVHFASPRAAQAAGVATVFQELDLVPELDVAANLFLGRERMRFGVRIDDAAMRARDAHAAARGGPGHRPAHPHPRAGHRPAADGRDRQGAGPAGARAGAGRADRGAECRRGATAVHAGPLVARARRGDRLHLAPARGGPAHRRPRHGAARRRGGRRDAAGRAAGRADAPAARPQAGRAVSTARRRRRIGAAAPA